MVSRAVPLVAVGVACTLLVGRWGAIDARAQATPSSSAAFQRGITLMETRGDCPGAIREFIAAAASGEPAIAARALLLKAECEERLGKSGYARETYDRLLTDYPGTASAGEARKRLSRLVPSPNGPGFVDLRVRRLPMPSQVPSGSISRDGRFVAFHDDAGVARRLDLTTGTSEPLVFGPAPVDGAKAAPLLLSPDGQRAAYMWAERGGVELRVMPLPDGDAMTLHATGSTRPVRPVAWTADGSRLFALATDAGYRVRLLAFDLATRTSTQVAEFGVFQPYRVSVSPDGRLVAYDAPSAGSARDIHLLDLASRRPTMVVRHAANDLLPEFVPDGSGLLFLSDRLGPLSLWLQPLQHGQARGEARLVRRDIGRAWPLGATSTGALAYAVQTAAPQVFVARAAGDAGFFWPGTPLPMAMVGTHGGPDWSPDGTSLVYQSMRGAMRTGPGSDVLVVRDRVTGLERVLLPDLVFFGGPRWSHDGTRLLVRGHGTNDTYGFFLVDARTGAAEQVLAMQEISRESDLGAYQWVPGREAIVYALNGTGIRELDLHTGTATTVVPIPAPTRITAGRGVAYAPDGERLAWSTVEGKPGAWAYALFVRDTDRRVRELLTATPPDDMRLMGWTPDGGSLLVLRDFGGGTGPEARTELWRVPVNGDAPSFTGLAAHGLRSTVLSPDGREVAYAQGSSTWETLLMTGLE